YATDPAGLDEDAFSVSSQGSPVEGFERRGEGWWSASFFGPPISVPNLTLSVSDRLGNVGTLDWSLSDVPNMPTWKEVRAGTFPGGFTLLEWDTDPADEEVLKYEIRQIWEEIDGEHYGSWQSVGVADRVLLEIPEGASLDYPYSIEVRAFNREGFGGFVARTVQLFPKAPVGFSGMRLR
ncbi:MAG: hypothetical protein KC940_24790, partial [Candidatus Omnitrophica bacterium]|nr:hypothetical protein [Candidatus Omnitrophota bacterium]